MRVRAFSLAAAAVLLVAASAAAAQSGHKRGGTTPPAAEPQAPEPPAAKKVSARPAGAEGGAQAPSGAPVAAAGEPASDPDAARYTYDFTQPDFFVHTIHIEHDEEGRGVIIFERRSDVERITEPFRLSPAALARVRARWEALDYLGSAESYQSRRDHSNLGRTRLSVRRGGRERTAEFNYSDAADAQALATEYRRAAEQAVVVFELGVAVESQPLETPKLINKLESLIKSNFLSDPAQLVPLLRQLAEDERVPLVGRNQAERILKKLTK